MRQVSKVSGKIEVWKGFQNFSSTLPRYWQIDNLTFCLSYSLLIAKTQTHTGKLGAAGLFAYICATWRWRMKVLMQNIIYLKRWRQRTWTENCAIGKVQFLRNKVVCLSKLLSWNSTYQPDQLDWPFCLIYLNSLIGPSGLIVLIGRFHSVISDVFSTQNKRTKLNQQYWIGLWKVAWF